MGKVAMGRSMSLDGFIARPNDGPGVTHLTFRVVKTD